MKLVVALLALWPSLAFARQVAFTFDDLPGLYVDNCDFSAVRKMNEQLVAAIKRNKIPALGVVNEAKVCGDPSSLKIWLDAKLELGNHTASHPDFNTTSLADFEKNIIDGEKSLRALGNQPRYFRFPFLHTGRDLAKKRAIENFLAQRGYEQAVVTIDNDDYIYAVAYARAHDRKQAKRIADDYIRYMESMFAFYEKFSQDSFGYEPRQILLLHDHQLNADTLDRLAAMARRRGYSFISIAEALRDPIYKRPDNYVGGQGLSWLLRWAKVPASQPEVPAWVMALFRARAD